MDLKLQNVVADLHAHGWCGQEEGNGQFILRWLGETGRRDLATLCEYGFLYRPEQLSEEWENTLIGIVSFGDTRYEKVVNTRGRLGRGLEVYDDHKKRFVGVHNTHGKWCFVLRGQEIPTDHGHVLILGGDKNIPRQYEKLNDVLKFARDIGAIIIADHPTAEKGIAGKIFSYLTNNGKPLSLNEPDLEIYCDMFDGIEVGNSNVTELTETNIELAKRLGLKTYASSDSHTLSQLFNGTTRFSEIDFSSWERARNGLLVPGKIHIGPNRKYENFLHGVSVLYNIARQKIGVVEMPEIIIE